MAERVKMSNTKNTSLSNKISLEVLVNNRPVKQYKHDKKVYIEGRKDSEYSIKVKNDNDCRVYAIISVDGLSIIDSTQASEKSIGFLIEKNSSINIPGWIVSEKSAAKFKFSENKNSYSEKSNSDNSNNIGVIGCIVIAEKTEEEQKHWNDGDWNDYKKILEEIKKIKERDIVPVPYPVYPTPWIYPSPWDWDYYRPRIWYTSTPYSTTPFVSGGCSGIANNGFGSDSASMGNISTGYVSNSSALVGNINNFSANVTPAIAACINHISGEVTFTESPLGTAFGKKTNITDNNFEKPFDIGEIIKSFVIFYDSRKNLEKIGIVFEKKKVEKKDPNPFPASKIKFCDIPEGWE